MLRFVSKMTVGRKIREFRQKKDWSLADLSKRSGVALSSLSRIETGKMTGTLESHIAVARALGVRLAEFYADVEFGAAPELVKAEDSGEKIVSAQGTQAKLLVSSPLQKKMLPKIISLAPKKTTRQERAPAGTEGLLHVLKGQGEVTIGEEKFKLGASDSLYFQASFPHSLTNLGSGPLCALWITSPPHL